MNILFINMMPLEYNSSSLKSNIEILNALAEASPNLSLTFLNPSSVEQEIFDYSILNEKIEIIRIKTNAFYRNAKKSIKNPKSRRKKMLSFFRTVYYKFELFDNFRYNLNKINYRELKSNYDLIITASDPKSTHLIGQKLKRNGIHFDKWIQYWGDPLTYDITRKSIYPKYILKYIEYSILKKCDYIIYVSYFTMLEQKKYFSKIKNKMFCIPLPSVKTKYLQEYNQINYDIGYFGDYSSKMRNLKPLVNCCNENEISLHICGSGDSIESSNYVKINERVDDLTVKKYESEVSILVCVFNNKGYQIPGKLFYWSSYNKPILVILDGENKFEMKKYLEQFDRYYFCENKEEYILEAIDKILVEKRKYINFDKFSPRNIVEKMFELFNL